MSSDKSTRYEPCPAQLVAKHEADDNAIVRPPGVLVDRVVLAALIYGTDNYYAHWNAKNAPWIPVALRQAVEGVDILAEMLP